MAALRLTHVPAPTMRSQSRIAPAGAPKLGLAIRSPKSTSAAGITTTAPPTASAEHTSTPTPSEVRILVGAIAVASSSARIKPVPASSTALPVVDTAELAASTALCGCSPGASSSWWKRSRIKSE